jgi:type IV secretory pathway VirB10-like protein
MSADDKSPAMAVLAALLAVILGLAIVALSLGVVVNVFRVKEQIQPEASPPPPVRVAEPPQPLRVEPEEVEPAPPTPLQEPIPEPAPIIKPEPEPAIDAEQPEEEPPPPEADMTDSYEDNAAAPTLDDLYTAPDNRESDMLVRDRLRISLNRAAPPFELGDRVELRRTNGMLHRGQLVSVSSNDLLIVDGEIRERVPLRELDYPSRLRVDPVMRESLIERRLRESNQRGRL